MFHPVPTSALPTCLITWRTLSHELCWCPQISYLALYSISAASEWEGEFLFPIPPVFWLDARLRFIPYDWSVTRILEWSFLLWSPDHCVLPMRPDTQCWLILELKICLLRHYHAGQPSHLQLVSVFRLYFSDLCIKVFYSQVPAQVHQNYD